MISCPRRLTKCDKFIFPLFIFKFSKCSLKGDETQEMWFERHLEYFKPYSLSFFSLWTLPSSPPPPSSLIKGNALLRKKSIKHKLFPDRTAGIWLINNFLVFFSLCSLRFNRFISFQKITMRWITPVRSWGLLRHPCAAFQPFSSCRRERGILAQHSNPHLAAVAGTRHPCAAFQPPFSCCRRHGGPEDKRRRTAAARVRGRAAGPRLGRPPDRPPYRPPASRPRSKPRHWGAGREQAHWSGGGLSGAAVPAGRRYQVPLP